MNSKHYLMITSLAVLLSGCTQFDMQGQSPQAYYDKHPIENKVETRYLTQVVHFDPYHSHLDAGQRHTLKRHFNHISPLAVDEVEIQVHPSQIHNVKRELHLRQLLAQIGISKDAMYIVPMEEVARHDASIQMAYSAVVLPRCPDWRPSGVTNYSNSLFTPNLGCASRVNLGLMVADPRDLIEGSGDNTPDTHSSTHAIQQYRAGETPPAESEAATTGQ